MIIEPVTVSVRDTGYGGTKIIKITFGQGVSVEDSGGEVTLAPDDWAYVAKIIDAAQKAPRTEG